MSKIEIYKKQRELRDLIIQTMDRAKRLLENIPVTEETKDVREAIVDAAYSLYNYSKLIESQDHETLLIEVLDRSKMINDAALSCRW